MKRERAKAVGKGQAVFISETPGLINQKLPSIKLELLLTCKMDVKATASEAGLILLHSITNANNIRANPPRESGTKATQRLTLGPPSKKTLPLLTD